MRVACVTPLSWEASTRSWRRELTINASKALRPGTKELSATAHRLSHRVEVTFASKTESLPILFLDVGYPHDESVFARQTLEAYSKEGWETRVGIGSSKIVARLAAQITSSPKKIIPPGGEKLFLHPLSVQLLSPPAPIWKTLYRWGIHTLGALARLPSGKITTYLGAEGWRLQQESRGIDPTPFLPERSGPLFTEHLNWEWELTELEPFVHLSKQVLEKLLAELDRYGFACGSFEVRLELMGAPTDLRAIRLRSPSHDLKTLMELLVRELSQKPPRAPLRGATFSLQPAQHTNIQLSLFGTPQFSPSKLAETLARLAALVGNDRIGAPVFRDGHRPERFGLEEYNPPPPPLLKEASAEHLLQTTIRAIRPPRPIEVDVESVWPFRPTHLISRDLSAFLHRPDRYRFMCIQVAGPWKVEESWWSVNPMDRQYWQIQLAEGGVYRIYRCRVSVPGTKTRHLTVPGTEWWLDGCYD